VKDGIAMEGEVQYTFNYLMQILLPVIKPGTKSTSKATYNPLHPQNKDPDDDPCQN